MDFDKTLGFQSIPGLITPVLCDLVKEALERLPAQYWALRDVLAPGRGYPGESCRYHWAGPNTLPKELYRSLLDIAPKHPELDLYEACVNRYEPGDYIGRHRDRDGCILNVTVPLQADGDGLLVDDVFYPDVIGQGNLLYKSGPAHSVPPAKRSRYVLIFLYTEKPHDHRFPPGQ
jgi:hypothetical protein